MNITRDFLEATYHVINVPEIDYSYLEVRPRVHCVDGFSISIQASKSHYCDPRDDLEGGEYRMVELGFPSEPDELITPYAESEHDLTGTVYGFVPTYIVNELLYKHGGIKLNQSWGMK